MLSSPAPGFRSNGNGTLYALGASGYNWSAVVTSSKVFRLSFYDGGINPQSTENRTFGFQVRCLQE